MIHVCSLSRLHATVDETGAQHIVTLLRLVDRVQRPAHIAPQNHLVLSVDDITTPMDGYTMPAHEHVQRLISFVAKQYPQYLPQLRAEMSSRTVQPEREGHETPTEIARQPPV